jgi:penicillin-binding protein 2
VDSYSKRKNIILFIFLLVGAIFVIRLFSLQVLDGSYKRSAMRNVLREVVIYPARGVIYDRNKELLVYNQATYDLMATPREVAPFDTFAICALLNMPVADFKAEFQKAVKFSRYKPSMIVKQVLPENYALLKEKLYKFPGFYFQTRTLRNYSRNIAAHVLGYISEVTPSVIEKDPYYRSGDYYGTTGIENAYEKVLRGKKGATYYMVDVHNRVKGKYEEGTLDSTAIKGTDVLSTLDIDLQEYGEQLMQNKAGSIVAIEPSSGEILAMISSPTFSPEDLVGRKRIDNFPKLLADTLLPLFNRAVKAQYPPGSTFKMLQGLIALQEHAIDGNTAFPCNGGFHVGNFTQKCHHSGSFTLTPAIAVSCNAYFSYAFRRLLEMPRPGGVKAGYDKWRDHVLSFGFGNRVISGYGEELKGFIPTTEYFSKRKFNGSKWHAVSLISLAIGQGEIQTTPVQMANYAAILANHGFYYKPHLVRESEGVSLEPECLTRNYTTVDLNYFDIVVDGMEDAVKNGTGARSAIPGITMCGKTGTAENPHGPDHSAFIAFAPRYNPKIAIAVYVENARWGATYAAPIASLMVEKYLNDSIMPSRKQIEKSMMETNLLYPELPNYVKIYQDGPSE